MQKDVKDSPSNKLKPCRAGFHSLQAPLLSPMKTFSLPKSYLLRKSWEYKNVYDKGRRVRGRGLTIIYTPNGREGNRLGISVHGIRKAAVRNRVKRVIREFYRLNRNFIEPGSDIVFAVRVPFSPDSPERVGQFVRDIMSTGQSNNS